MGLLHGSAADCSELHWLGKSASGSWDNSCVLLLTPSYLKEAWHPGKRHRNLPSTVRSYWSLWSWLSWLVKISSRSLLTESSLNTNLSTINAAALFKYSNHYTLDCLAMSTGSGNFVGWLPLSENPSTDVAAAVTLDLTMIRRKSRSAQYAVCGSDFTFLRFIRVRSENSVQLSISDLPEKTSWRWAVEWKRKLMFFNMRHATMSPRSYSSISLNNNSSNS